MCVGPSFDYVALRTFNPYTGEKITVVLAEVLVGTYFKAEGAKADMESYKQGDKVLPYEVVGRWKGSELVGMHYSQLMQWVKPVEKLDDMSADYVKNLQKVILTTSSLMEMTGLWKLLMRLSELFRVIMSPQKMAPASCISLQLLEQMTPRLQKNAGIPPLFMINAKGETRPMVDFSGKYYTLDELAPEFVEKCVNVEEYSRHAGDYVKNAYDPRFNPGGKYDEKSAQSAEDLNIVLCMEMKKDGEAFRIEKHVHNYPHCWRTDKPVLYYPLDSWFIRTTAARDRLIELNGNIKWKPASTGSGRFGKWLENLQDWNLSRSRYWGTPLPIWRTEDGREEICIGSYSDLYNEIEKSVNAGVMASNPLKEKGFVPGDNSQDNYDKIDLHRPYVDDIVLVSESGKPMKRELDLIDVWFDSGAMPYAQIHYPFENKGTFWIQRRYILPTLSQKVLTRHADGSSRFMP